MTDDLSVSANLISSSPTPEVSPSKPVVTPPVESHPAGAAVTTDDFDDNLIPEGSRENFKKYRESQKAKASELETKLNAETRKRMEYEATVAQIQAQQRNTQQPIGEQPDYKNFSTIEEYRDAVVKWAKQAGAVEFQGSLTQRQQQQLAQQEASKMMARGNAARAKYPDFDQVTGSIIPIANQIPVVVQFIKEFDNGTDVLYHLGKNPAVLEALSKLQPFAAGQELLRIQSALSTPAPKAVSQAPAPINPVSTGGDGNVKSVLELVKKDDATDYVAREMRRELRRKKGAE